jgi:hypothetical protein
LTNYALEGHNNLETNSMKLVMDYQFDPEGFNWDNYPWYFDSQSEKYTQMQMGVKRLNFGQMHDLKKCKELIEDSENLITILKKELDKH